MCQNGKGVPLKLDIPDNWPKNSCYIFKWAKSWNYISSARSWYQNTCIINYEGATEIYPADTSNHHE